MFLHLSARKLRNAPHRARLPGKKFKVKQHTLIGCLYGYWDEIILSSASTSKRRWVFQKDKEIDDENWLRLIGGGGLAGYICPWLPHLPYSSCTQKEETFISLDELDHLRRLLLMFASMPFIFSLFFKYMRHFRNNWTCLFLNRPFILHMSAF